MQTFYTLIEKQNDKLHEGRFHIYADEKYSDSHLIIEKKIPINDLELKYVPITEDMANILVTRADTSRHIDLANTSYDSDNNQWNVSYVDNPVFDPVKQNTDIRDGYIQKAQLKLLVPDLSDAAKELFNNYISALNDMEINNQTVETLVWPTSPL